jgi:peptidoglycan hydrolase CwlO-like protein
VADVERSKRDLESNVQRKEREIGEAVSRLEAEQGLVSKQQRMIKEIQGKVVHYARNYNPRFVYFLPRLSLRFML